MISEKLVDVIDECLDQHDDAITANTTLIEEALVRIERLEKLAQAMWRPQVARDEAEDRVLVLLGEGDEEEKVPLELKRRLRRIARGRGDAA